LPPTPRQNFNERFGFKYDPASQTPVSGVSQEGKITIKQKRKKK